MRNPTGVAKKYPTGVAKNLEKLRKNVTNMTDQQKEQYKRPLYRLKLEIARDAVTIMRKFVCAGCLIPKKDREGYETFVKEAERIMTEDGARAAREAGRILFSTFEITPFLESLIPIRERIYYEAYGPVWLSHCCRTKDLKRPYQNDIIRMEWEDELGVWVDKDGAAFILALPPTKELLDRQCKEHKGIAP